MLCVLLCGCPPSAVSPTQTVLNTLPADVATLVCAMGVYEKDSAAHVAPTQIVADEIQGCGNDVATILTTIGKSHVPAVKP